MNRPSRFSRPHPAFALAAILLLTMATLVGCGLGGATSGLASSVVLPLLLLASLITFMVGCGTGAAGGGDSEAAPTPTPAYNNNPPAGLKFLVQPSKEAAEKSEAFTPITPAPEVAVVDSNGKVVTTSTAAITISLSSAPAGVTLQGALTRNAIDGVATFSDLRINLAGNGYTLTASAANLPSASSVVFNVGPLPPNYSSSISARTDFPNGVPLTSTVTAQATGRFNNDQNDDLVYASSDANVRIMLGDGNGGYKAPSTVASGYTASDVRVVDLNNDGRADIVLADTTQNSVRVLLGNGDGTFNAAGNYALSGVPVGLAVDRFNSDSSRDVAVSLDNAPAGAVAVFAGDGTGQLSPTPQYSGTQAAWQYMVTADNTTQSPVRTDLVIARGDGNLQRFFSNNDGTFSAGPVTNVSANPLVRPVRFIQNAVVSDSSGSLFSLLSNFGVFGSYQPPVALTPPMPPVASASLNAQFINLIGLITTGVAPHQNTGGSVATLNAYVQGATPSLFAVAHGAPGSTQAPPTFVDLTGFQSPDLAVALPGATSVLRSKGGRIDYAEPPVQSTTITNVTWSTMGLTVLSSVRGTSTQPDLYVAGGLGQFAWLKNKGDGTFNNAVVTNIQTPANQLALGDVNVDGQQDVVLTTPAGSDVKVLLGVFNGQFVVRQSTVGGPSNGVALGDLNKDGKLDLVVNVNNSSVPAAPDEIRVLMGNGDGSFRVPSTIASATGASVPVVADLNNDGKLDVVEARPGSGVLQVMLGNGNGSFQASQNRVAPSATAAAVGDFNKDGKPDIAVSGAPSLVTIHVGDGKGGFSFGPVSDTVLPATNPTVADVNCDGKPDLVLGSTEYSDVVLLLGNGDGSFQAPSLVGTQGPSIVTTVVDLNGDFKPDFVSPNQQGSSVTINLHQ